jgi:enoyl-CoA hydratase/carnithine racemase
MLVTDDAGVRQITLARPDRKNALTQAMYAAVIAALEQGDNDSAVRMFVITAHGTVFTSGNDLADFAAAAPRVHGAPTPAERFPVVFAHTRKPIMAAVNGAAVGVGVTMLLQCDLVDAAPTATFRTPFVDLALVPEGASSLLMPAAPSRARCNTSLMLGETWTAQDAPEGGLLSGVIAADDLLRSVMTRARSASPEFKEAAAAFMARRPADFSGFE